MFEENKKDQLILFNDDKQCNKYSVTYERKTSSALISLGNYGLIEARAKRCTANMHGDVIGDSVMPCKILAPTESRTVGVVPFPDKNSLSRAIALWNSNRPVAIAEHSHIKTWNTSLVMDMHEWFNAIKSFNDDVSLWDTSSMTTIKWMFREAFSFNQDISEWDVSQVNEMNGVFECSYFESRHVHMGHTMCNYHVGHV